MSYRIGDEDLFDNCPCKDCIVRAICQEVCDEEIKWFNNLSHNEKLQYFSSKLFKPIIYSY